MSTGTERQREMRRRRKAAGWIEVIVWLPALRIEEARVLLIERFGKPPPIFRP